MGYRWLLRCILIVAVVGGTNVDPISAQSAPAGPALTVEEVLKMWKTNVPEDLIITMIKKNGKAFNLVPEELQELRNAGMSDIVLKFLLDPSIPYAPPAPPSPAPPPVARPDTRTPPKQYPADSNVQKIPADSGLYRIADGSPQKTDIKLLLGVNQGPGVGKVLMKKAKAVGYLIGSISKTRVEEPSPTLYIRLPEGKTIEEVVLVALDQEKDRRKIEVGPTLEKQQLKADAMRPFDSLEVGPRLFRVTPAKLAKGEYMFFLLGSAEPPKGVYGKGYDFGIEASR